MDYVNLVVRKLSENQANYSYFCLFVVPSATPTPSITPTGTPTRSRSTFQSTSATQTPAPSKSPSVSASASSSVSLSVSPSPLQSPSQSVTVSTSQTPEVDCNGVVGGTAVRDDCAVCGGTNSDKDDCGVCFGNNDCLMIIDDTFDWEDPCMRFTFNEATDRGQMDLLHYDCSALLRSSTIKKLGTGNYCYWESDCIAAVCEGNESSFLPNDIVEFLPVIHSQTSGDILYSTNIMITNPNDAPKPIAILNGPEFHSACGEIMLDASYSIPTIYGGLRYNWKYLNPQEDGREDVIQRIESVLASQESIISLSTDFWRVGTVYQFRVTVTNVADASDTSRILNVLIVKQHKADIRILAPRRIFDVDVTQELILHSEFQFSECASTTDDPLYHWQVVSMEDNRMLHTRTDILDSALFLPAFTLPAGGLFNITLSVSDGRSEANTYTVINTVEGKICAKISEGLSLVIHRTII